MGKWRQRGAGAYPPLPAGSVLRVVQRLWEFMNSRRSHGGTSLAQNPQLTPAPSAAARDHPTAPSSGCSPLPRGTLAPSLRPQQAGASLCGPFQQPRAGRGVGGRLSWEQGEQRPPNWGQELPSGTSTRARVGSEGSGAYRAQATDTQGEAETPKSRVRGGAGRLNPLRGWADQAAVMGTWGGRGLFLGLMRQFTVAVPGTPQAG